MGRGPYAALACSLLMAGSLLPVRAQSLAEVARKEEERRKAIAAPSKVITNADLRPAPRPASSVEPKADDKAGDKGGDKDAASKDALAKDAAAAKEPAKDTPKAPVKDQAYWTDRVKNVREQLSRDEMYAEALQSRINALTTDWINRDDPAQKRVLEQTRLTAIAELDRLKQRIPEDKKAIDDLQEEARRAGVPPGWLR